MRPLPLLGALIFFLVTAVLRAQEDVPLPKAAPGNSEPSTAAPNVPQLIPPLSLPADVPPSAPPVPTPPSIPQLDDAFKQSPISASAENARLHQEWRDLRNRLAGDEEIKGAQAEAEAARTDLEKRKLLHRYYDIYFDKLTALAATPELKAYLAARKAEALAALPQPRVRPTPTPSPSPKPKS